MKTMKIAPKRDASLQQAFNRWTEYAIGVIYNEPEDKWSVEFHGGGAYAPDDALDFAAKLEVAARLTQTLNENGAAVDWSLHDPDATGAEVQATATAIRDLLEMAKISEERGGYLRAVLQILTA